ncbi:unnamed protein product [Cochlearia groenlandica]
MSSLKTRVVTKFHKTEKDPYGISSSFGRRDIDPYTNYLDVKASSVQRNRTASSSLPLIRHLKGLLGRLSLVNLQILNQQEKLAFWINIYNSFMMNMFKYWCSNENLFLN